MQPAADPQRYWLVPGPSGAVRAVVTPPASKSITNRALVLAALADGPTVIRSPLAARDTALMADALRALGRQITSGPVRGLPSDGASWLVDPGGAAPGRTDIDVGNAGTVLRFVPPVAALSRCAARFRGDDRVAQRPVGPLLAALAALGADIDDDGGGAVPFTVHGRGSVSGGTVTVDASSSSQLVSGLLLSAARFEAGARIRHQGPPVPSAPHVAMTVAMLRGRGVEVDISGGLAARGGCVTKEWAVRPGPVSGGAIEVEPDLPAALPFLAAALVTGGQVTIGGWPATSLQPAGRVSELLTAAGGRVSQTAAGLTVTGTGVVRGITADLADVGELTPVLTALAALASEPSELTGIGHLRKHESDRLAGLAGQLGALGGDVTELADGLRIRPRPLRADRAVFDSLDDHRMVMAAAVIGLAVPGLRVASADAVGKTFPAFAQAWERMLATSR